MKIREIIGEEHGAKIEVVRDQNRQTTAIIKFTDPEVDEALVKKFVDDIKENEELKGDIVDVKAFYAFSREISQESGSNNITVIIIVMVIVIAVVVFLLAFAGGFLIWRKRDSEGRRGQGSAFNQVPEKSARAVDGSAFKSRFRNKKKIYPDD